MKLDELAALLKHADTCVKKQEELRVVQQSHKLRLSYLSCELSRDDPALLALREDTISKMFAVLERKD